MVKIDILGVRGQVQDTKVFISALQSIGGGEGLALDADMICGRDHLISATMHAKRAFERGVNASTNLAMETMLYASGERQISKATRKMGLKVGCERMALVLFNVQDLQKVLRDHGLERDDTVLEASVEKALRFGISHEELRAVPADRFEDLVLERVAFVGLHK
jgi:KEOPS complex subunit Cgi121